MIYAPIYDLPLQLSQEIIIPSIDAKDLKVTKSLEIGYFGKVLLAELAQKNSHNNKLDIKALVAIKKLKENCIQSVKRSFHKELKFMSRLQHENIVQVLGACLTKEQFIVLEYVINGDLENYLQKFDYMYINVDTGRNSMTEYNIYIQGQQVERKKDNRERPNFMLP